MESYKTKISSKAVVNKKNFKILQGSAREYQNICEVTYLFLSIFSLVLYSYIIQKRKWIKKIVLVYFSLSGFIGNGSSYTGNCSGFECLNGTPSTFEHFWISEKILDQNVTFWKVLRLLNFFRISFNIASQYVL